jgi:hypothetical protein
MKNKKKREKRISFGDFDAAHVYSLAVENFCVDKKEGVCFACLELKSRIEKFIGEKEAKYIQRQIKKYPNQTWTNHSNL